MSIKTLRDTNVGDIVKVKKVTSTGDIKRRLLDIGLTPGTKIENAFKNPFGDIAAYEIRGALIAIRDIDSRNILVEEVSYD